MNRDGTTSIFTVKGAKQACKPSNSSTRNMTSERYHGHPIRSSLGVAPLPPDYPHFNGPLYEGIDQYNAKDDDVFYLESEECKKAVNNNRKENDYIGMESTYTGLTAQALATIQETESTYITPERTEASYITPERNTGGLNDWTPAVEREKSRNAAVASNKFSSFNVDAGGEYTLYNQYVDSKQDYMTLQNT